MGSIAGRPSTARARELGVELRRARERAGYSGVDLARRTGWSTSKVSRMESGTRTASEVDVAIYLTSCGVVRGELERLLELARESYDQYWLRPHGKGLPDELRSLVVQETTADAIASYEPLLIPGLLQTENYMREVFRSAGPVLDDDVEMRVRARTDRQSLLHGHRPPKFVFFVHENALRSIVGGMRVMHDQLLHLVFSGSRPQSVVRVVPRSAGSVGMLGGSFKLLEYSEHAPVAYVENRTTSLFLEDREDLVVYRWMVRRLAELALDGGQSREWLARLASEYDRVEDVRDDHP